MSNPVADALSSAAASSTTSLPAAQNADMHVEQPAEQERMYSIRIWDHCQYPSRAAPDTVVLRASQPIRDLRAEICRRFGYDDRTFRLTPLVDGGDSSMTVAQVFKHHGCNPDKMLLVTCCKTSPDAVFPPRSTSLMNVDFDAALHPPALNQDLDGTNDAAASTSDAAPSSGGSSSSSSTTHASSRPSFGPLWSSSADHNKRSECGFVGLSNQGATCYMNSLLQTLYMTLEFRAALYQLHLDGSEPEAAASAPASSAPAPTTSSSEKPEPKKDKGAIPRQLQRLFARLQLSPVRAVKTKDLTRSFGWKDADAFTQHDVQELCRVLFDALETVLKGTDRENLINELYQGEMKDYVQCRECGFESSRTDKYLDIPLVIKPFGEHTAVRSVQEALARFVQPELLEGENQWRCARCNKKVDAKKGLKLLTVPYLLTLQLKRFDFDPETLQRLKLNDRVEFPLTLDMSPFVDDAHRTSLAEAALANIALTDSSTPTPSSTTSSGTDNNEESKPTPPAPMQTDPTDPEAGEQGRKRKKSDGEPEPTASLTASQQQFRVAARAPAYGLLDSPRRAGLAGRPNVYQLYSILIHRGSSMAGHYYAYIRSFETGKWYEFNDSYVSEINVSEIEKAFGDDDRNSSSFWNRGANAYMLMYRRVDPVRNVNAVHDSAIGERLRRILDLEAEQARAKEELKDKQRDLIRVKLLLEREERSVQLSRQALMRDVCSEARKVFAALQSRLPECVRLRRYDSLAEVPGMPYADDCPLEQAGDPYWKEFYVETRASVAEDWPVFVPTHCLLRVVYYDAAAQCWQPQQLLSVPPDATLGDLKKLFEERFGVPTNKQTVVRELAQHAQHLGRILWNDPQQLAHMQVQNGARLYVEYCENPRDETAVPRSKNEIERVRNTIDVYYNTPGTLEYVHRLTLDRRMRLQELKARLEPLLGLRSDEFRVLRGANDSTYSAPPELKLLQDTLDSMYVQDGSKLTIERGRPTKPNEVKLLVWLYEPVLALDSAAVAASSTDSAAPPNATAPSLSADSAAPEDRSVQLFEVMVEEDQSISAIKAQLVQLAREQQPPVLLDPARVRLREFTQIQRTPGRVFADSATLRDYPTYSYYGSQGRTVAVQPLSGPEPVRAVGDFTVCLLQWRPSKFELGPRVEVSFAKDTTVTQLKQLITQRLGVKNVGVCQRTHFLLPDLLDMPQTEFDRLRPDEESIVTLSGSPFFIRDGEYVVWRDNDELLKELTAEEKQKLKRAVAQNRNRSYGKEKSLHIDT